MAPPSLSPTGAQYDVIGRGYGAARRPDPRIAAPIHAALGGARRVLNVGAGTGNYEPPGAVAVEPSRHMIGQRPTSLGPAVRAIAERLPVRSGAFDATLCTFTLHHWLDLAAGLAELQRVARRQVMLLSEPVATLHRAWLIEDYLPEGASLPSERRAPTAARVAELLPVRSVEPVPVPADCTDGFTFAYWNRPEAYLDPAVRAGMSLVASLPPPTVEAAMARLADDLASGAWDARHGHLRGEAWFDAGYRLVVADRSR